MLLSLLGKLGSDGEEQEQASVNPAIAQAIAGIPADQVLICS